MVDKRRKFDWAEIQKYYDENQCSTRELAKAFGFNQASAWKAKCRGDIVFRTKSESTKLSYENGKRLRTTDEKVRSKISNAVNALVKSGKWHVSLAKNLWKEYNGVKFHGTWEVEYAKWLDRNNIRWRKPTETFQYTFQGKTRRYTPDFYLTDERVYIEIKGYETEKDKAKWLQFPLNHRVLKKHDLALMGIEVK
jgi:hypothetical protein